MPDHTCRQGNDNCRGCFPTRWDRFVEGVDAIMENSRFAQWIGCALILSPLLAMGAMIIGWIGLSFFTLSWAPWSWLLYRTFVLGIAAIFGIIKFFQWCND